MFGLVVVIGLVALVCYGFYAWARKRDHPGAVTAPAGPATRVPLVVEALAYLGVVLILAGGFAALARRWKDVSAWGHVGLFAGGAVLFLLVGAALLGSREPALQRIVSVTWFLAIGGIAGAVACAMAEVYDASVQVSVLVVGLAATACAAALWAIRRRALQQAALFGSLLVAIGGVIATIAGGDPPALAFTLAFWGFGLLWVALGWRRYVEPMWVALPLGILLALLAPSFALDQHGWVYAIAILTPAAVMAASVPLRNTVLLAIGTVTLLAYLASMVSRYFADSLGTPAALSLAGVLVLVLAGVGAQLLRMMKRPTPTTPTTGETPDHRDDHHLPHAA